MNFLEIMGALALTYLAIGAMILIPHIPALWREKIETGNQTASQCLPCFVFASIMTIILWPMLFLDD